MIEEVDEDRLLKDFLNLSDHFPEPSSSLAEDGELTGCWDEFSFVMVAFRHIARPLHFPSSSAVDSSSDEDDSTNGASSASGVGGASDVEALGLAVGVSPRKRAALADTPHDIDADLPLGLYFREIETHHCIVPSGKRQRTHLSFR